MKPTARGFWQPRPPDLAALDTARVARWRTRWKGNTGFSRPGPQGLFLNLLCCVGKILESHPFLLFQEPPRLSGGEFQLHIMSAVDEDDVFKALADHTRRRLLDQLHANNGQTLGELCRGLDMTRQAVSQHLTRLEAANLVATLRHGREKRHYLSPVPIHEIHESWVEKFEDQHLRALRGLKKRAEGGRRG